MKHVKIQMSLSYLKKNRCQKIFFWLASIVFVLGFFYTPLVAEAAAPRILSHQGRLLNASGSLLGGAGTNYCFRFSIYDNASVGLGSKIWPTGTPSKMTVSVKSGVFNVGIGDTSAGGDLLDYNFEDSEEIYLNVEVAASVGGSCASVSSFETLSPRQRIFSSGYAINANTLRGFGAYQSASSTQIPVLTSGNLILGGVNPQVNATGTNALVFQGGGGTGDIRFFNSSNVLTAGGNLTLIGAINAGALEVISATTTNLIASNVTSTNVYSTSLVIAATTSMRTSTVTGGFFQTGLGDCSLESQTLLYDETTGKFMCGVDTSSGSATSSNFTTPVTVTDGVNTSQLTATGLTIATSTSNLSGLFFVDNSGSVSASGTLQVSGNTNLAGLTFTDAFGTNITSTNFALTGSLTLPANSVEDVDVVNGLTIDGGSINNTAIGATGASTAIFTSATATANFFAQSLSFGTASGTSITSTNLSFSNLNGSNVTSTNLSVSGLTSLGATTLGNATSTNFNTGALSFTTANGGSLTSTNAFADTFNSTNLTFGTANGTSITSTNLFTNTLTFVNASGISVSSTNVTTTNIFISENFTQKPRINPTIVGTFTSSSILFTAGSVDVVGKYAYVVAGANSLQIIDVSNPNSPLLVGGIQSFVTIDTPLKIQVVGKYAYVISQVNKYLKVVDISDVDNPQVVGTVVSTTGFSGLNDMYVSGKYAYLVNNVDDSLRIVDISNPTNPVIVGGVKDATFLNGAYGVYVSGRYAYVANRDDYSLSIVDISDPTSPVITGRYSDGGVNLLFAQSVYVSGQYAYVGTDGGRLAVVDVSSSTLPFTVGNAVVSGGEAIYVSGKYAYLVDSGTDALNIVDVSVPTAPVVIGSLVDGTNLDGASDIKVVGKYAYVTSFSNGTLSIIDLGGIDAPSANIGALQVSNLNITENFTVANDAYISNGLVVGSGGIKIDGALAVSATSTSYFNGGLLMNTATTTNFFATSTVFINATSTFFAVTTSTVTGGFFQAGLSSCNADNETLAYNATSGKFECGDDDTGGSGLVINSSQVAFGALDGSATTSPSFTFATSTGVLSVTSVSSSNVTSTNFFSSGLTFTNLFGINATTTNLNISGATTLANVTSTNFFSSGLSFNNLAGGNITSTANFSFINASGTSITSTNISFIRLTGTSITSTNLSVSGLTTMGTTTFSRYVSIGTTTLSSALSVIANGPGTGLVKYQNAASNGYTSFDLYDSTNTLQFSFGHANLGVGGALAGINYINSNATNPISFMMNNVDVMRITSARFVGIGTTSPQTILNLGVSTTRFGGLSYGSDTYLYRLVTSTLRTDGNLNVAGNVSSSFLFVTSSVLTNVTSTNFSVNGSFTQNATTSATIFSSTSGIFSGAQSLVVSGKYVYVVGTGAGSGNTMTVIDTTNLGNMKTTDFLSGFTTQPGMYSLVASGNYVYGSTNAGLRIFDVTNPSSIVPLANFTTTSISGTSSVYLSGEYAYVTASTTKNLSIIDISNPTNPTVVGSVVSTTAFNNISSVYVSGKYAYTVGNGILSVVDVLTTSTAPFIVGTLTSSTALSHASAVYVSGRYAYVVASSSLRIIDVANPSTPTIVGGIRDVTNLAGARSLSLVGQYAYITNVTDNSVRVINISSSTAPTIVAGIKDNTILDRVSGIAISGKYAYVVSGDGSRFNIINLGGIEASNANIGALRSNNIQVTENLTVGNNVYITNGLNVGLNGIYTSGALSISGNATSYISSGLLVTSVTSTNFFVTSTVFVNASSTNIFSSGIQFTNLSGTNATSTNLAITGLTNLGNTMITDASSTNFNVIGLSFTSASGTNVSSTNIFVSGSYHQSTLANSTIEETLSFSTPEQIRVVGKYVYLTNGVGNTFGIIDVADPTKPVEISTLSSSTAFSFIKGLDISGKYAYVSGLETVQIIDISNPSNPTIVGGVTSTDLSSDSIYVSGNYAYVSGVNSIQVINISNPSSPTIVGAIVSSTALGSVTSLYVSGAYAYVSDRSSDSLRIIDISNPANPTIVGGVVSSTALNDAWSVYISGKYAYIANETDDSLRIVDVSNPTSPTIVGGVKDSSLLNGARSVSVSGKYAYVAARDDNSIRIIDVSSSTNPMIVGGVKSDSLLYGARSVSVSGKYAYTANWAGNSIGVIGLGGMDAPIATIGMLESGSINITENLMVANNTHIGSSLIVGLGGIKSDGGLSAVNSDVFLPGLAAPSSTSDILCLQPDGRVTHQSSNCTVSSARFKHDIVSWDTGLSTVMQLRPVIYKRNYDNVEELGLIAEEVDQVNKLFVIYEPGSTSTPRSVDYERLVIPLISAVQSQQQQIDGLLLASIGVNSSTPRTMSEEELLYAANRPLASAMTYLVNRLSDGATVIKDFLAERVTAVVGVFERIKTNRLEVDGGIQMKDKSTGEVYCVVIDNGEITKIPGVCGESIDSENSELQTPSGFEEEQSGSNEEEIVSEVESISVPEEPAVVIEEVVPSTDTEEVEQAVTEILSDLFLEGPGDTTESITPQEQAADTIVE